MILSITSLTPLMKKITRNNTEKSRKIIREERKKQPSILYFNKDNSETEINSNTKSLNNGYYNHILTQSKIKQIRELKASLINNENFKQENINELDNVFSNATKDDEAKHITLSAYSRPEKYYQAEGIEDPDTKARKTELYRLMESRQKYNQRLSVRMNRDVAK